VPPPTVTARTKGAGFRIFQSAEDTRPDADHRGSEGCSEGGGCGAPLDKAPPTPLQSAAQHPFCWEGEGHCQPAILARLVQRGAQSDCTHGSTATPQVAPGHAPGPHSARRGGTRCGGSRPGGVSRPLLRIPKPHRPSPTIVFQQLGAWHRDGGEQVQVKLSASPEIHLTFNCWGSLRKRFNAAGDASFQRGVVDLMKHLLVDGGSGAAGREAVRLSFPFGTPSDAWLMSDHGADHPQLVLDLRLRLKDDGCKLQAAQCVEELSRLLGDVTGVDSVECAILDERSTAEQAHGHILAVAVENEQKERAEKAAVDSERRRIRAGANGREKNGDADSSATGDANALGSAATPMPRASSPTSVSTGRSGSSTSRRRPVLEATVGGQTISHEDGRKREAQIARGEAVQYVVYRWKK
jgi:hypothetical protein